MRKTNFLLQDIFEEKSSLQFTNAQESVKEYMKPFKNCLAEPIPIDKLNDTTIFQIVDLRDTTKSILSTIESLQFLVDANESYQDKQRNNKLNALPRRIINDVDSEDESNDLDNNNKKDNTLINNSNTSNNGPFRFTLQDCFGNICYAYESEILDFPSRNESFFPVKLGSKIIVYSGAKIMFNALHLKNENIKFLGGYLDKLRYGVYERKLKELKEELEEESQMQQ